jgi:hypothetical protein
MQKVNTLSEAVEVLMKAAEVGRKQGVYDFESCRLIAEAMNLLQAASVPPTQPTAPDFPEMATEDSSDNEKEDE